MALSFDFFRNPQTKSVFFFVRNKESFKKLETIVISKLFEKIRATVKKDLGYGCLQYSFKQKSPTLLVYDLEI